MGGEGGEDEEVGEGEEDWSHRAWRGQEDRGSVSGVRGK